MQDGVGLFDRVAIGRQLAPPGAGIAAPFANGERHGFKRAEVRKQRVDLERAHEAALDALLRTDRGDVVGAEEYLSGVGLEHAGHQVDERGLAGAVRSDQRVALAMRQVDPDAARDHERAEALVETASRERERIHARLHRAGSSRRSDGASCASPPKMPFGRKITTAISSVPIQKYQYCGLMPENWSRATM